MTKNVAFVWIFLGMPIAVLDAWLSMQSLFGIVGPKNLLGYFMVGSLGVAFTAFAVLGSALPSVRENLFFLLIWLAIFLVDVVTSVFGGIWYIQFAKPLNSQIRIESIEFDITNWASTSVILVIIALAAWGCIKMGEAARVLTIATSSP
ncbi:hypothetical protein [Rhodococcus sp. IEGM 1374]|jgi:hypothetical protein|uniref:hypothetical protein n=1 Tax=Rhodococcus sp. IEGM 1374 TaxID=3082221 RepID=UPI002955CAF9|nr:hypothetical protein [Rhodococcus sp. IEGM 1374]MDV7989306.1 hypothetical protein [Rhodococcus sp. IEGM 1374]